MIYKKKKNQEIPDHKMATSTKSIYLNCKFLEKDQVKQLGAHYDGSVRKWFIPVGHLIEPFKKWIPKTEETVHDCYSFEMIRRDKSFPIIFGFYSLEPFENATFNTIVSKWFIKYDWKNVRKPKHLYTGWLPNDITEPQKHHLRELRINAWIKRKFTSVKILDYDLKIDVSADAKEDARIMGAKWASRGIYDRGYWYVPKGLNICPFDSFIDDTITEIQSLSEMHAEREKILNDKDHPLDKGYWTYDMSSHCKIYIPLTIFNYRTIKNEWLPKLLCDYYNERVKIDESRKKYVSSLLVNELSKVLTEENLNNNFYVFGFIMQYLDSTDRLLIIYEFYKSPQYHRFILLYIQQNMELTLQDGKDILITINLSGIVSNRAYRIENRGIRNTYEHVRTLMFVEFKKEFEPISFYSCN